MFNSPSIPDSAPIIDQPEANKSHIPFMRIVCFADDIKKPTKRSDC